MARYKVDIAALSETRFSEKGQLEEVCGGYIFWSGRPKAERRDASVAFAIQNDMLGRLPCLPQGINDRLMSIRLPFGEASHVDAPSVTSLAASGLCSLPEARSTGRAGEQGDPRCRLLNGSPPHRLQDEAPTSTPPKAPSNELANRLANLLVADEHVSVENRWCRLRVTVQSTALDALRSARHQHQDWFNDNDAVIKALLTKKNQLLKVYVDRTTAANKTALCRSHSLVQQRVREVQDAWMTRKA
ncbi:unnamed protein product [Schistocephalus solidus]|uniref:Uncharacterized protein n=1 Tax=Schistocephalus solidus TaxID=70667 RepID=A0A3P7CMP0_SCHSO|nr:unnamed protein product [Schistocephalus solidus]